MALDISELVQAFWDAILQLYRPGASSGGGPPALAGQLFLAFEPIGIPAPPSMFRLRPADTAPSPGLAVERLTDLANQIPEVVGEVYRRTGRTIDSMYEMILTASRPSPASSAEGATALAAMQAEAKHRLANDTVGSLLVPLKQLRPVAAEPPDWYDPDASAGWTTFGLLAAPAVTTVSDGTAHAIHEGQQFDLDLGVTAFLSGEGDFEFVRDQPDTTFRPSRTAHVAPLGTAQVAGLGAVEYGAVTPDQLRRQAFGPGPIPQGQLAAGRVFAVRTKSGHYSKVQVISLIGEGEYAVLSICWATAAVAPNTLPADAVVSQGVSLVQPTGDEFSRFSFDRGAWDAPADISLINGLTIEGNARIINLGFNDFNALDALKLKGLTYGTDTRLSLKEGDVFAVRTNGGNYAKVQVLKRAPDPDSEPAPHGFRISFRWVTFAPPAAEVSHPPQPATPAGSPVRGPSSPTQWGWGRDGFHVPAESESLELSFEACAVTLDRPWFSWGFLSTRNWFIPGYRAGEFSSINLPAVPIGLILVRKLTIRANGSADDLPARAATFGPFNLADRTVDVEAAPSNRSDIRIRSDGMQIIGWIGQSLSGLPPDSDPALNPA
jgi:hypothetical protein